MRLVALCCLLAFASVTEAETTANTVSASALTVLLDFDQKPSSISVAALGHELQNILAESRMKIDVRMKNEISEHAEFEGLVLFRMKGACSIDSLPIGALSDERGALAMTYAVNGEMLPFGEVQCDRVRRSIQRTLQGGTSRTRETALGIALARVMAHEMYHMLSNSRLHTKDGVTKESLSGRELLNNSLTFSLVARQALESAASVATRNCSVHRAPNEPERR